MRQFFLTKWDSLSYKLFQFLLQSSAVIFLQSETSLSQVKLQAKYYKLRQNRENYYKERQFIPNWRNYYTKWEITLSVEFSFKLFTTACITKRNYFFAAKRRNVRREQISTRQELDIFFGSIPFYFPPISNISILLKTIKMYIFPTYSPKRNLQSHILRGYLKNSANKICDVMYG